jgi:transposase
LADHDLPRRIAPRSHHCWLIDGPINGETFQLYVEKVLVPTLWPGDIVIMDNLGSHKGKAVRRAIRAAGARLFYLPKYSPDLNPIEQFFAKFKHWLRKAARRTTEAVYNAIGPILDTVSAASTTKKWPPTIARYPSSIRKQRSQNTNRRTEKPALMTQGTPSVRVFLWWVCLNAAPRKTNPEGWQVYVGSLLILAA